MSLSRIFECSISKAARDDLPTMIRGSSVEDMQYAQKGSH